MASSLVTSLRLSALLLLKFWAPMVAAINLDVLTRRAQQPGEWRSPTLPPSTAAPSMATPAIPMSLANYTVEFTVGNLSDGSNGTFVITVHPEWAPLGEKRLMAMVNEQFLDNSKFFRVIPGFIVQFGIASDPLVTAQWRTKVIKDDPPLHVSNARGRLSFAANGPGSRATQMFINLADNFFLDSQGFTPFAEVISGMHVVDSLYSGYGEGAPLGPGPSQTKIEDQGNAYLDASFPGLSYIQSARIVHEESWSYLRLSLILPSIGIAFASVGLIGLQYMGGLDKLRAKLKLGESSAVDANQA